MSLTEEQVMIISSYFESIIDKVVHTTEQYGIDFGANNCFVCPVSVTTCNIDGKKTKVQVSVKIETNEKNFIPEGTIQHWDQAENVGERGFTPTAINTMVKQKKDDYVN